MDARLVRWVYISTMVLVPLLLSGCWGIRLEADTPRNYTETEKIIESYYGATQEEILREFGTPDWTEKTFGSTYYIYQWKSSDKEIVFFVIPIPVAGGRTAVDTYCLLLEFDEKIKLINHESVTERDSSVHPWWDLDSFEDDCMDVFSRYIWQLEKLGGWYSSAESGEVDAQIRIGDIYSIGLYSVEQNLPCAYVWYSHAQANGSTEASDRLKNVAEEMTPTESDEAIRLLNIWQPGYCESDLFKKAQKVNH